jgi:hypothetical protein
MSCSACLEASIYYCDDSPVFYTGLDADTDYTVTITSHFGTEYTQDVTSDSGGNIAIDVTKFPDQLFNPNAGKFTFEVKDTIGNAVNIVSSYTEYSCIVFDVIKQEDAN